MAEDPGLRFVPSRVEGIADVTEVAIYSDRLELLSAGRWASFRFAEIAAWPRPAFLWRRLDRLGWRRRCLPVGERDWFHPPSERFFRFFTQPPIVVYLPDEPADMNYGGTLFRRTQEVMMEGGFNTWDLG